MQNKNKDLIGLAAVALVNAKMALAKMVYELIEGGEVQVSGYVEMATGMTYEETKWLLRTWEMCLKTADGGEVTRDMWMSIVSRRRSSERSNKWFSREATEKYE